MRVVSWLVRLGVVGSVACNGRDRAVREWLPSDHSQESNAPTRPATPDDDGDPMLVAPALWSAQCAACHGTAGQGDGPQAAFTRPPDLTVSGLLRSRTDEQLRAVITFGRGAMPPFRTSLRPEGIDVLVRFLRQFDSPPP